MFSPKLLSLTSVEIFLEDEFWIHGGDHLFPAAIGKYALTDKGGTVQASEVFDKRSREKFRRFPEIFRAPAIVSVEYRIHSSNVHEQIYFVRSDGGLDVDAHIMGQV